MIDHLWGFVASKICGVTKILINLAFVHLNNYQEQKYKRCGTEKYAEFEREREILLDMEDRLIT